MENKPVHSIRTKFTLLTVCAILVAVSIATLIGVIFIRNLGSSDVNETMMLMCRTGEMNLDSYFASTEKSVKAVSSLVQDGLDKAQDGELDNEVERARSLFETVTYETEGVLTYYLRLDPSISQTETGFWYVNLDGKGFKEREVTDISLYDINDTSSLVWFTVPRGAKKGVWLPPYYTENLGVQVISYNVPLYWNSQFVGVVGIELDYKMLAQEVGNIRLYDSGYAFLLDENGTVIYHPLYTEKAFSGRTIPDVPEELLSDETHIHYFFNGVQKTAVWLPLNNGMRLYVTVPDTEINRGWQDLVLNILLASLLILIIVSIITMRFTNHLTKPLLQLTEAAKQVDNGNYDFELDYNKNDEVGNLTRTFKDLASNVKNQISNLDKQAYVDALTSVRNQNAYGLIIAELDEKLETSEQPVEFAMGVFDCDNLKAINDQYGHDKGDIYLKNASHLICEIFKHSPVFRIGGDEFAVVLQNEDYRNREDLFALFREAREEACKNAQNEWEKVNVTLGYAVYDPTIDVKVIDVARRADRAMYENKRLRKAAAKQAIR